jgi:uncharacterized membrane protein
VSESRCGTLRSTSPSRLIEIDVARVMATMFMVQGHTLDVLLAPAYRGGWFYNTWLFLRGLTAPTFLLLAGFSFMVSAMKHWDSYLDWTPAFFRRIRKFAIFMLLGYAMHLPVRSFRDLASLDAAGWRGWFQVDVLQCIGLTLLLLQFLVLFCRKPERCAQISLAACAGVVFLSPLTARVEWANYLGLPFASYLNFRTGSLFPLFPWSGYILLGSAVGYASVRWREQSHRLLRRTLPAAGLGLIIAGSLLTPFFSGADFWTSSPGLFLLRAGGVFLLVAATAYVTSLVKIPVHPTQSLAQESLSIYFAHICILYGSVWNTGLRQTVGATLTAFPTALSALSLMCLMTAFGLSWHWFKKTEPRFSQLARTAAVFFAIAYCIT